MKTVASADMNVLGGNKSGYKFKHITRPGIDNLVP